MPELCCLPEADDVTDFSATVTEAAEAFLILDGTYFYPEGGSRPASTTGTSPASNGSRTRPSPGTPQW